MVEAGKSAWPEGTAWARRTTREVADAHNSLTREERVRRLIERVGLPLESVQDMQQDEELADYRGYPVDQVRILLHRKAADLLASGEAQALPSDNGQTASTPEEWAQQYVGQFDDALYLDVRV